MMGMYEAGQKPNYEDSWYRLRGQLMTAEHFQETLEALIFAKPFKAFTIELNTGQRFEIDHPLATTARGGHAVFISPGGVLVFFDHESVNQIINAPAHSAPGKRRSK